MNLARRVTSAFAIYGLLSGVIAVSAMFRSYEAVSAAAVSYHSHYATYIYRECKASPKGHSTTCGRQSGYSVAGYPHVWLRSTVRGVPQTIIESAGAPSLPCPNVVVDHTLYDYPYTCGTFGPGPSAYDSYMAPTTLDVTSNLLYGSSAAREFQHSRDEKGNVSAHRGSLEGRSVYIVDVKSWPGYEAGEGVTLYFDTASRVLLGIDYESSGAPPGVEIRLIHEEPDASQSSWTRATKLLPAYAPVTQKQPHHIGADLVGMDVEPSISSLASICPRVHHLSALLHSGSGPLRACRTAYPRLTASLLAWRLMRPSIRELQAAERAGIFPRAQVKASIKFEHGLLSLWVTYRKSLKYS